MISRFPFRLKAAIRLVWASLTLIGSVRGATEEDLPLPRWTEEELRLFQERRGSLELDALLPDAPGYLENLDQAMREPLLRSGPRLDELPPTLSGEIIPRLRAQDLLSFLPDASKEEVRQALPTAKTQLRETSQAFLSSAAKAPGDRYLIDPAGLLPEMTAMGIERLLEFHASDARIHLFVLVMAKNETLPPNVNLDSIASGKLVSSDACLVVYPLAEPWRARLLVSRTVHDKASPLFLPETASECVRQALVATEAGDQLERYLTTLSPRLFWLQKAMGETAKVAQPAASLRDVAGEGTIAPTLPAEKPQPDSAGEDIVPSLIGGTALAGLLLGVAWAGRRWRRLRLTRQQTSVWILPEPEVPPRLGGAFCGGAGLVIRYE